MEVLGKGSLKYKVLAFGIVFLFIASTVTPVVISIDEPEESDEYLENMNYDSYHVSEITNNIYKKTNSFDSEPTTFSEFPDKTFNKEPVQIGTLGLMDLAWPMYCHDTHHTGRSPYSTVDTWDEIWKFETYGTAWGGPAIDDEGTIYIGAYDLHAVYPNGTLKWTLDLDGYFTSTTPAIDDNRTLYIGTRGGERAFYAINLNGTIKWSYPTSGIYSSPVISDDGTIIFGDSENWKITALFPNGTLKWAFRASHVVYSSPAIGDDGTIYCGSHDQNLYALYPNNGTEKWRYRTDHWIRTSPCIADDGTIYVVSLDNHIYAINPDGSLKWRTYMGEGGTSPTIGWDGTIYAGYRNLHAIYPTNGSIKWTFNVGGTMRGGTPCNSIDGTIYVGTSDGGELIAINSDGTEKWRKRIANQFVDSAPAIAEDGTIYVGSAWNEGGYNKGYLHAFGIGELEADANGPYYGLINKPVYFEGHSRGGYSPHSFHWDFGDDTTSDEQNPTHNYTEAGNYSVTLTVTDNTSNTSNDTSWAWIQTTNTPPNKPTIDGPTKGEVGTSYDYSFLSIDTDGNPIWYYIEWGDGVNSGWIGHYSSGQEITVSHTWDEEDTYTIRAKAKDVFDAESEWETLEITMPVNQPVQFPIIQWLLDRFPNAFQILRQIF